jgi:hypothetical protein
MQNGPCQEVFLQYFPVTAAWFLLPCH